MRSASTGAGGEDEGRAVMTETRPTTVLLVDDDPEIRTMARICLSFEEGEFDVVAEAADGEAAIEAATALQPEVVLLDLEMPGTNGLAAIPGIRAAAPGALIAVLSAFPDPFTLAETLSHGADTYLDKAMGLADLPMVIRALLESRAESGGGTSEAGTAGSGASEPESPPRRATPTAPGAGTAGAASSEPGAGTAGAEGS